MSSREGPGIRGRRRGRRLLEDALDEFHGARLGAAVSQVMIGRAIGRSDAWVSWTESGKNESVSVVQLSEMLACVGLELSMRAYPSGGALRDAAQLGLIARFVEAVVPPWRWATEVPIPIPGDLRAWDGVLRGAVSIGVDAETRIRDLQAIDRRVTLKLRDSGLDRAVILVSDTRANRAALASAGSGIAANYPIRGRAALAALRAGRDPGGNSIIVLPGRTRPGTGRAST